MKRAIVPMAPHYIDSVLAIERQCFADPWPAEAFLSELDHPWSLFRLAGPAQKGPAPAAAAHLAAVPAGGGIREVEGYVVCWMLRGDLHLLNVAVHPEIRRAGIAKLLLKHVFREFALYGGGYVNLEVRPSNQAARSLYQSFGFQVVGRRKGYYRTDNEDALLMERIIRENEEPLCERVRNVS